MSERHGKQGPFGPRISLGDESGINFMDVKVYPDGEADFWVCDGSCRGMGFVASKKDLINLKGFLNAIDFLGDY